MCDASVAGLGLAGLLRMPDVCCCCGRARRRQRRARAHDSTTRDHPTDDHDDEGAEALRFLEDHVRPDDDGEEDGDDDGEDVVTEQEAR
eukprot:8552600-Alexandrium_andersonii.AAC.1